MAGPGGPGDAGDGLRARRRQLFGRPAGRPDFTSPVSSIFDGFWGPFFMFFLRFLYKFPPIEFNTVFYRMWMSFRYQGSCEKTILTLYPSPKLRNRGFRNRIDFLLNSASIRGTYSVFFHVFSVYFFGIDFRMVFFFDFVWVWELPGRPVRPRCRPGSATSDPGGHPDIIW